VDAHEHTGSAETARPSPRNGFTAYFVLSPVSEFVLSPSTAGYFPQTWHQQRVSGPHDLAVRSCSFVRAYAPEQKRPPHPWPNASWRSRNAPRVGQGRERL